MYQYSARSEGPIRINYCHWRRGFACVHVSLDCRLKQNNQTLTNNITVFNLLHDKLLRYESSQRALVCEKYSPAIPAQTSPLQEITSVPPQLLPRASSDCLY